MSSPYDINSYISKSETGIWRFRLAVPHALRSTFGKNNIKESLKTKDYLTARRLGEERLTYYRGMIARAKLDVNDLDRPDLPLVQARLKGTLFAGFDPEKAITDVRAWRGYFDRMTTIEVMSYYQKMKSDTITEVEFQKIMRATNVHVSESNPKYVEYLGLFKQAVFEAIIDQETNRRVDELRAIKNPSQFEKKFLKEPDRAFVAPTPLISDIYIEFLALHPKIADDKDEKARFDNVVKCLIDFVGDIPANYLRKDQARDFIIEASKYPVRRDMKSITMTFQQAINYHQGKGAYPALSARTVKVWIARLKRIFTYAIDVYDQQFDIRNPFSGIDKYVIGRASTDKRDFSAEEIAIIFGDPIFQGERNHLFWLPILLVMHGSRASEFANRKLLDVKQDALGLWYVDVVEGKNATSVRQIPLHQCVIDLGFIDYVKGLGEGGTQWLFPQFNRAGRLIKGELRPSKDPSAQFSQWFGRFMDRLGLIDKAITLHSFRHTWISTATRLKIAKEFRTAITGHAAEDVHSDVYTHHDLATLKSELDKVEIKGFPYDLIR